MPPQPDMDSAQLTDLSRPIDVLEHRHRHTERVLRMLRVVVLAASNDGRLSNDAAAALEPALAHLRSTTFRDEHELFELLRASRSARVRAVRARLDELAGEHRRIEAACVAIHELGSRWLLNGVLERDELASIEQQVDELRSLYVEHVDFEDSVLFHLAREVLDSAQVDDLADRMRARAAT